MITDNCWLILDNWLMGAGSISPLKSSSCTIKRYAIASAKEIAPAIIATILDRSIFLLLKSILILQKACHPAYVPLVMRSSKKIKLPMRDNLSSLFNFYCCYGCKLNWDEVFYRFAFIWTRTGNHRPSWAAASGWDLSTAKSIPHWLLAKSKNRIP